MAKKHKTLSSRSRKAARPAPAEAASQPTETTAAPELAHVHHLSTCAVLSLPRELWTILGDEGYARCVQDFEDQALEFLIHIDGHVVYLRSQMILLPRRPHAAA